MLALSLALVIASATPRSSSAKPPGKEAAPQLPSVEATFQHDLSTPAGPVAITWPALAYDRARKELFVVAEGFVRIFDASGMEVHRFGDDGSLGNIIRAVPLEDGEIVVITTLNGARAYLRCDFRGEPIAQFSLTGLPESFAKFEPDLLIYHDGRLYFAERGTMRVAVTDVMGVYRESFLLRDAIAGVLPAGSEQKPPSSMDGFSVDDAGNMLFTMSTMFACAVLTPNGDVKMFGARGSTPGRFNITGGIASDEAGRIFVTDRLRSVVSVWDRELHIMGEFGYRGDDVSNLMTPFEIAVGNGKVFVAQAGKKGVKAFRVRVVDPEPPPDVAPPEPPAPRVLPRPDRSRAYQG
jgi:hypothetical protein